MCRVTVKLVLVVMEAAMNISMNKNNNHLESTVSGF